MTNRVRSLGVIIPAHHDGPRARSLAAGLLASADNCSVPATVVVGDNGGNDDLSRDLGSDSRVRVVTVADRGPGHARTAAARHLVDAWDAQGVPLDDVWIVSLDADSVVSPTFLADWVTTIETSSADVLSGHSILAPLPGEPPPPGDVAAASSFLWSTAAFLEQFAGIVNVGGCNHAVRARVCAANDFYVQPVAVENGREVIVPGDDWDFGVRAHMRGFTVGRAESPTCLTSARRITSDPAGFLAGRTYEKEFRPIADGTVATAWPPAEDWGEMAEKGRTRVVSHFLMKGVVAGLPVADSLGWFLGDALWRELKAVPLLRLKDEDSWQRYRSELIARIFSPELVELARRISHRLLGV